MRNHLLICLLLAFFSSQAIGQSTLPNLDLENWTNFGNYEEPSGGAWTTANKIVDLLPGLYPATTLKTTDAHSGTYAARLITDQVGFPVNLLVTGTLATGTFNSTGVPPDNLKLGVPFTGRPDKFTGWYKYTSVSNDSCDMYALLSKWNGSARDTIGVAAYREYNSVPTYTMFDLPFVYQSGDTPDSISIVFASSSGGANFVGQIGSELILDDVALETASGLEIMLMPEVAVTVFPNPTSSRADFAFSKMVRNGKLEILDLNGKALQTVSFSGESTSVDVSEFAAGNYFFRAWDGAEKLNTGHFIVEK